jgi:hypothetical protein
MQRDTITESIRWGEIPHTIVDVCDMHTYVIVTPCTACGLLTTRGEPQAFATRHAALAYVAAEYGLTRQAMDGETAWCGWWLS